MIPFDPNWAIQDIAPVDQDGALELVKEMKNRL